MCVQNYGETKWIISRGRALLMLSQSLGCILHTKTHRKYFQPTRSDDFFSSRENERACSPFPEKTINLRKNYRLFVCSRLNIIGKVDNLLFHMTPNFNNWMLMQLEEQFRVDIPDFISSQPEVEFLMELISVIETPNTIHESTYSMHIGHLRCFLSFESHSWTQEWQKKCWHGVITNSPAGFNSVISRSVKQTAQLKLWRLPRVAK